MDRLASHRPSSVSVIVTTYNNPGYLRQVLTGYLAQSVMPTELLVADDGSGEETADVINEFRLQAPFPVIHIWHEDQGFRAAKIRNEACKATQSEYLVFSDGDCIPHTHFISDHLRTARRGCFIQGKRILVSKGMSPLFIYSSTIQSIIWCLKGELRGCHHLLRAPWVRLPVDGLRGIRSCNMALFRDDLYAVNGFNQDFTGWGREDSELAVRLFNYGLKRRDIPFGATVFHLWHSENSREKLQENDRLLNEILRAGTTRCRNGIVEDW